MAISKEQQLGRAKNAVLEFLESRITVPKIYLDATWDGQQIDVLAIDREGAGDVHAVLLFNCEEGGEAGPVDFLSEDRDEHRLIKNFTHVPANFKYIGAVGNGSRSLNTPLRFVGKNDEEAFAPDGIGRIGLISVDLIGEDDVRVNVAVKPERFRAKIAKLANEYIEQHIPDWELRA
jgi:hypothetical protein